MYPSRFRYEAPRSLEAAIALLREGGEDAKVLAGGQSLVPLMKLRFASPALLVDINNLPGLAYHRLDPDGTLHVGALCHADPQGDWASVTMALGGSVIAQGPAGRRTIPVADFVTGPFQNVLAPDEIVVEAVIPAARGTRAGGYLKLERRVGDFATAGVAVALELDGERIIRAGLALTGVGGSTIAATEAEQSLVGQALCAPVMEQAATLAAAASRPKSDHRGSAEYKRHIVRTFVMRILTATAPAAASTERAA